MQKGKLRLKSYEKILSIVMLLIFLIQSQGFAMPLTEQQQNLNEEETRFYTDLEIEILIDEISEAALEAIEQAAGEAARAAVLSMLEREAITLRENQRLRTEAEALRRNRLLIGVLSFIGGLITGVVIKNHLP